MNKIGYLIIFFLAYLGSISMVLAQNQKDFEMIGLQHFKEAYYRAIPQDDDIRGKAEFSLAEEAFKKAIERNPDNVNPYLYLGRTYFVQKKYPAAADVYRQALDLAPENNKIRLQLASALEKAQDYEGAIGTLQDLRARETDARTIALIDHFIEKMRLRAKRLINQR